MEVTQDMLEKAMKKAVELGVMPQRSFVDAYLVNWDNMHKILEAALKDA